MQLASYAMRKRVATIKGGYLATLIQTTGAQTSKDARKVGKASKTKRAKQSKAKQEKESGRDDNLTPRPTPV
jgi:hypothetical protein